MAYGIMTLSGKWEPEAINKLNKLINVWYASNDYDIQFVIHGHFSPDNLVNSFHVYHDKYGPEGVWGEEIEEFSKYWNGFNQKIYDELFSEMKEKDLSIIADALWDEMPQWDAPEEIGKNVLRSDGKGSICDHLPGDESDESIDYDELYEYCKMISGEYNCVDDETDKPYLYEFSPKKNAWRRLDMDGNVILEKKVPKLHLANYKKNEPNSNL